MTVVALLLILIVTAGPLAYAAARRRPVPVPEPVAEDRIRIGDTPSPDILITKGTEAAERIISDHTDHLHRVRRLIERYPERGTAVVRSWMDGR